MPDTLPLHLAAIHRELGIPTSYAAERRLAFQAEANEPALVDVGPNPDGREVRLVATAARAWRELQSAAGQEGIILLPISGFRSVARQTDIIMGKLAAGIPIDAILRYIAAPGFSEHHTGCALDIGTPGHVELDEEFAHTPAFRWLETHAGEFGFSLSYPRQNDNGIGYEPWHWLHRI